MLNVHSIVARKEIADSLRDTRSVVSSLMYALMGPAVVFMVMSSHPGAARPARVLIRHDVRLRAGGRLRRGMNVAMDTVAGERERRSLVPLLLNPVPRRGYRDGEMAGRQPLFGGSVWRSPSPDSGCVLRSGIAHDRPAPPRFLARSASFPCRCLAASLQLLISTVCRGAKEAHTYLSMLVFLPMGIGMFLVFFPVAAGPPGVTCRLPGSNCSWSC